MTHTTSCRKIQPHAACVTDIVGEEIRNEMREEIVGYTAAPSSKLCWSPSVKSVYMCTLLLLIEGSFIIKNFLLRVRCCVHVYMCTTWPLRKRVRCCVHSYICTYLAPLLCTCVPPGPCVGESVALYISIYVHTWPNCCVHVYHLSPASESPFLCMYISLYVHTWPHCCVHVYHLTPASESPMLCTFIYIFVQPDPASPL